MAGFYYAVKTDKMVEEGKTYYGVIARGTKKRMLELAAVFDANPTTIESKVVREKDNAIIHEYHR